MRNRKIYTSPLDPYYHAVPYSDAGVPCPAMTQGRELYFMEDSSVDFDHPEHFSHQGVSPALWFKPCHECIIFDF